MANNGNDDELYNLFSALGEVRASDELKDKTLTSILAQVGNDEADADRQAPSTTIESAQQKATGEGNAGYTSPKAKWRAIRIGAIAACLALALTGGVAYAVPATYYEITQDGATITLGVNCFGITVSATSDDELGKEVLEAEDFRNMPYEQSASKATESMERRAAERRENGPSLHPDPQPQSQSGQHPDEPGYAGAPGGQQTQPETGNRPDEPEPMERADDMPDSEYPSPPDEQRQNPQEGSAPDSTPENGQDSTPYPTSQPQGGPDGQAGQSGQSEPGGKPSR